MSPPQHIFVLSGAGLSAESGLVTFRDADGLWRNHDPMALATPEAFADDPELVHAFYNERRAKAAQADPNPAHKALARLQTARAAAGFTTTLCTQNVDDLLVRAGAREVLQMHGELAKARCAACGHVRAQTGDLSLAQTCGKCGRIGTLRPHIVWFGEMPMHMAHLERALAECDLFVAIGTSGAVYPAAGFVTLARQAGAPTLEINLEPSDGAALFDDHINGPATETVPVWVDQILGG